jgi:hypothetical protein
MIKKLSRKRCLQLYPKLPWSIPRREKYVFPKTYNQYIITLQSKTAKSHAKNIAVALQQLVQAMGYGKLVFLGDTTVPLLYQQNKYKPVQEAQQYLQANKISDTFNGGLLVDAGDLPVFVRHLFWLVRGNAALPIVYAMDEGKHIVANLCHYGNIHFFTLDEATDKLFNATLAATGMAFLKGPYCYEAFGRKGKIGGREVVM